MSNHSKYPSKNNGKINTAWFLWSKFLSSPLFPKFKLCGNAQSLMMHLVRLMDAKLSKYGTLDSRKCEITLNEICYIAGMSDKPARKYLDQLIKFKIIELVQKLAKNRGVYKLGILLTVTEFLRNCEQVSYGVLETSYGDSPELVTEFLRNSYNNTYVNKTNNNGLHKSKDEKQAYKQAKASPLLEEFMNKDNRTH